MSFLTKWFPSRLPKSSLRAQSRACRLRPRVEHLEERWTPASPYLVTSLADTNTPGTLRFEINLANTDNTGIAGTPDLIQFKTNGGAIGVTAPLPALTDIAIIDGTTATGYIGTPIITLEGKLAGAAVDGLIVSSGFSTVKGLAIVDFSGNGIRLDTNGSDTILNNFIGITTANGAAGNGLAGVFINGTSGNIIGGTNTTDANVISGNSGNGIFIDGPNSTDNQIIANFIGTSATGTAAVGNSNNGIEITNSASLNTIGGSTSTMGNVISGNGANGVLLTAGAGFNTVSGNFVGTNVNGNQVLGNKLDGVAIQNGANNNLIGQSNPVTGVTYYGAHSVPLLPVTAWQGIRESDMPGQYLIVGSSNDTGLLFDGTIAGVGTSYAVNYPNAVGTSVYGPDNLGGSTVRLVGSYRNADASTAAVKVNGFLFEGTTADLSNSSDYRTIDIPGAEFNYIHSTMGDLAVGNYDSAVDHGAYNLPLGPGHAFLYDVATNAFLTDIAFPGSISNSAYGIWYNGGTSYTIAGGWSPNPVNNFDNQNQPIGQGYLVDYDSSTGQFTNWTSFSDPSGINLVTHFEGISSVEKGVYTLNADTAQVGSTNPAQGSWVTVRRNTDGSFGNATWVSLNVTGLDPKTNVSSSNSVYGNQVVGLVVGATSAPFQATINIGFQLSNVISGNGGNGISLFGANNNQIAMNDIGTDATGTLDLGNGGNGIWLTAGSAGNQIGGQATGGNDPTNVTFVRPPLGNLISANSADGVRIDGSATLNVLSGNYIGTAASGVSALGNTLDGVAIDDANGNQLIGCTFQQDPFVFYNVIGGNGGNGLRITDSNGTTVQANFFGMGSDNTTAVGNALDGVIIEGSSENTQFGGVIPLGNVVVANGKNGVEIAGTASGTVVFNTFCGLPAFKLIAVPNALDGMLITSIGGNNLIRTNVISGNDGNGVHISGFATGVQLAEDIIGMDTNGSSPIPNGADGVLIDGNAHDNLIGGEQVSVVLQNTISSNGANGVAIVGNALNNRVFHSFIGTDIKGLGAFGNSGAGILIGGNAKGTILGGTGTLDKDVISGNHSGGIQLSGTSQGTFVIGDLIGTDRNGQLPLGNQGNGISIVSSNNQIGGTASGRGNVIAFNTQDGVSVDTGTGNSILGNSIFSNTALGIGLTNGGNLLQAAPALTAADRPSANTIETTGTLTAAANKTYRIELFASSSAVPPGQGETYLGFVNATTNAAGLALFSFSSPALASVGNSVTGTATDPANNTSAFSAPINVSAALIAVGADAGGLPDVKVYNAVGSLRFDFNAYAANFTGGVRVAVADVNGDGVPDIITAAGPGGGPHIEVFDGVTGNQIASFFAFNPAFTGGVYAAAADVNHDGHADIIVGAGAGGGPQVIVIDGTKLGMVQANGQISNAALLQSFFAYDQTFTGGVNVAAGDVNGDGNADIITGAGPGGGPHVKVFSGATGGMLDSFFAFASTFTGGVFVSAGDVNGDGKADIIVGAGPGGEPQVKVFSGANLSVLDSFLAYDQSFTGGVRVGAADVNGDGLADIITGAGPGGGPHVKVFNGLNLNVLQSFFAEDPTFTGGVFVG